jgi:hypothetical protein
MAGAVALAMLQIFVYGPTITGFLRLSEGSRLQVEKLNDVFDEEFLLSEWSLPVEAPFDDYNRKLLGFAEIFENNISRVDTWQVDVYNNTSPFIYKGKMTMLEKTGQFNYLTGKFNFTISGSKGLLNVALKNKKLPSFTLGGPITWSTHDSRQMAQRVMTGLEPSIFQKLRFAPVAIENYFDTERKDYNNEFLAKDCVNNIVRNTSLPDDYEFGRPLSTDPDTPVDSGGTEYADYRTVPFFRYQYIFLSVLNELGYTVTGDWIFDEDWSKLVIFNNYSIEDYVGLTDYNRRIDPKNHVPDVLAVDWIVAVAKTFNFKITIADNTINLRYRKKVLEDKRAFDATALVGADFQYQNSSENNKGWRITFADDSADSYFGDRIQSTDGLTLEGNVDTPADLSSLPGPLDTDSIASVDSVNMIYRVIDAIGPVWEPYSEALTDITLGDGQNTLEIPIKPMASYVEIDENGYQTLRPYVGYRGPGSYQRLTGGHTKNPYGLRMFFIDLDDDNIPESYNHRATGYSLSLTATNSFSKLLHEPWLRLKENQAVIKTRIRIDERIEQQLNNADFVIINNVYFLRKQINVDLPYLEGDTAELELVLF